MLTCLALQAGLRWMKVRLLNFQKRRFCSPTINGLLAVKNTESVYGVAETLSIGNKDAFWEAKMCWNFYQTFEPKQNKNKLKRSFLENPWNNDVLIGISRYFREQRTVCDYFFERVGERSPRQMFSGQQKIAIILIHQLNSYVRVYSSLTFIRDP